MNNIWSILPWSVYFFFYKFPLLLGCLWHGKTCESSRPHFPSGIVERAKRERTWKSPHTAVRRSRLSFLAFRSLYYPWITMGTTRSLGKSEPLPSRTQNFGTDEFSAGWKFSRLGVPFTRYENLDSLRIRPSIGARNGGRRFGVFSPLSSPFPPKTLLVKISTPSLSNFWTNRKYWSQNGPVLASCSRLS